MKDSSHLEVAAQGGAAEVRTAAGVLLARLETGKAMGFTVQDLPQVPTAPPTTSGQAAPAPGTQLTLHGIVRKDHAGRYGHYLLTDVATKITYELQGPGLDDLVGAQVEVIGSIFDSRQRRGLPGCYPSPTSTRCRCPSCRELLRRQPHHNASRNKRPGSAR